MNNTMIDSFINYIDILDNKILENTKDLELPCILEDNKENVFFRCILHLIRRFLNSEDEVELFIELPTDELGTNESIQTERFKKLQECITYILRIATIERQKELIKCPEVYGNFNVGDVYFWLWEHRLTDPFLDINNGELVRDPELYGIVQRANGTNGLKLFDNRIRLRITEYQAIYNHHRDAFIKTIHHCSHINNHLSINGTENITRLANSVLKEYDSIQELKHVADKYDKDKQYNSALIVGYLGQLAPRQFNHIESPVQLIGRYDNQTADILCCIGDRKLSNSVLEDIRYNVNRGRIKKAIYIGTDSSNFTVTNSSKRYKFSFREMYYYLASDCYPKISIETISFPWLSSNIERFNKLLNTFENVSNRDKKLITHTVFSSFLGINQQELSLNNVEESLNEYDCLSFDYIDQIVDFCKNLIMPTNNPKLDWFENQNIDIHNVGIISSAESYKKKIKRIDQTTKNIYIDLPFDSKRSIDIINRIRYRLIPGNIHILSYLGSYKLTNHIKNEDEVYQSDYRTQIWGVIEKDDEKIINQGANTLELYFNDDELPDLKQTNPNNRQQYSLAFTDMTNERIYDGDVIFNNQLIDIEDLVDDYENEGTRDIKYYSPTREAFESYIRLRHNFPEGQDINYFSNLWRNRLIDCCEKQFGGNYRRMKNDYRYDSIRRHISEAVLRRDSFPNELPSILRVMINNNLLTQDEKKYILAAKLARYQNSKYARELKSYLFEQIVKNNTSLEDTLTYRGIEIHVGDFIKQNTLSNITIIK